MKVNKNIKIFVNYFLGPALFGFLVWSVYHQISSQKDLDIAFAAIRSSFNSSNIWYLIITILLMVANLSVETYKWMLAVRQVQRLRFWSAFKAVFTGIAFSVSTPNSVGDYIGRVLYLEDGNRIKAAALTVVANLSQLIVTFLMGSAALFLLKDAINNGGIMSSTLTNTLLWSSIILSVLLLLFYFRLPWVIKIIDKLPRVRKFSWAIVAVEYLSATLLLKFLSLSVVRFLIFSLQYVLIFRLFAVNITIAECWMGISAMFLVMAIIPTIALFTDMGLKNELSIRFIGLFSGNHLGISLTSLSIWFINLVFPALLGSFFTLGLKNIFKIRWNRRHHSLVNQDSNH